MNTKTKIEWCDTTWNPVVGCKRGCSYCYAERLNDRFKFIPDWNKPEFFPKRLKDKMPNKPSKIFVCSMADMFGDWVKDFWIEAVFATIRDNPRHTFQLLTKNPKRYLEFKCLTNPESPLFLKNVQCGVTIDVVNQARLNYLKQLPKEIYKFISFEPLLGDMSMLDLTGIDLVIIGADSTKGATSPKKEWVDSIQHPNIFYKSNLKLKK